MILLIGWGNMKKKIIDILKWIWQFPQNIAGFILSRNYYCYVDGVYWKQHWNKPGVSLGNYIIVDKEIMTVDSRVALHEKGHQKQSLMFGPLYLLIIGLPSAARNIYDRIAHRNWSTVDRICWYYNGFPEKWADELGGVVRL